MKNLLLHIVTPLLNILVYFLAYVLMRCWSFVLGFLSFAVPEGYKSNPTSAIWTFICAAFGILAISYVTRAIAPSGKKNHFLFIAILLLLLDIVNVLMNGANILNIPEGIGIILGIIGGVYLLKYEDKE